MFTPMPPIPYAIIRRHIVGVTLASFACAGEPATDDGADPLAAVIARGDSLALPGEWSPPPGDALELHTAGFATTLCAAVFITGLDPADAAANVGFFTGPLAERARVTDTVIDRGTQTVRLRLDTGVWRVAKRFGSQGCIALPKDRDSTTSTSNSRAPSRVRH